MQVLYRNMDLVEPHLGVKGVAALGEAISERVRSGEILVLDPGQRGQIPVLAARGESLPEAWENAILALFAFGTRVKTQYDKSEDPPSIDCSMTMIIGDPLAEPRLHRSFPGGLEDLAEYTMEVVEGVKDHWIRDPHDPEDTRWEYTYHGRMRNYTYETDRGEAHLDQFECVAEQLAKNGHTRRAQIVTWQPWQDNFVSDPACWQSLWGRITEDPHYGPALNLNMRFRSRDAYKAAFMNTFAFTRLGEALAERICQIKHNGGGDTVKIPLGRFVDHSDSFHIYGSYFGEFVQNFLRLFLNRPLFEDRTWTMEFAAPIMAEARPGILEKIRLQDENYRQRQASTPAER